MDSKELDKKINELMEINKNALEQLFDRFESAIEKHTVTKNGIKYAEATRLKMELRRIRQRVMLIHKGIIK